MDYGNFKKELAAGVMLAGSAAQTGVAGESRQLEVPHQLDAMERNLTGLAGMVQELESRLSNSILRPQPPQPDTKEQLRPALSTPVAANLQSFNDRLVSVRVSVESMLARLEA